MRQKYYSLVSPVSSRWRGGRERVDLLRRRTGGGRWVSGTHGRRRWRGRRLQGVGTGPGDWSGLGGGGLRTAIG